MEYTVTDNAGRSLKSEADNWLLAAAHCLMRMDVDINAIGKLVCVAGADGSVTLKDELAGMTWVVREKPPEPQVKIMVSARSERLADVDLESEYQSLEDEDPSGIYELNPPTLEIPTTSLAREKGETLGDRLFDLSMDLMVAEVTEAFNMALDLLEQYVPSETAAAVRMADSEEFLQVLASRGRGADELAEREIPIGEGLIGMCYDMRETVRVPDVARSIPYSARYDGVKAFDVGCILVVPVVDDNTLVYGVLELMNPRGRAFIDADVEAVETIAQTLGQALANR